jgi:YesN/AraC family two-component response regulator
MKKESVFHNDNSFYMNRHNYVKKHSDMEIHHHDYLTVSLILTGSLIEHTSESTKVVKTGSVLIKPPALMHSNIFTEDCSILSCKLYDYEYYNFNWDSWTILPQSGLLKQFIKVIHHTDRKQSLTELKEALLSNKLLKAAPIKIPEKIKHVKSLIDHHFIETIKISDLANEVNLNSLYLGQAFIQFYKIDIKSYQQQLRLHFTVSNMFSQEKNLTQIAYKAGYADQSHFSRAFKKSTDFSPKNFTTLLNL